jgi:glucose/arabinose dehydrogenase
MTEIRRLIALLLYGLPYMLYAQLPAGFARYEIARDLNPTDLAIAPDGRVFITEKDGLVRIVENGVMLADPFLILEVEDFNEQGLGHIALDPNFPTQPFVYLYYTVADGNGVTHNRVTRVTADGNRAVPGSEVVLYNCDPTAGTIHNAGDLVFGADGKLYIGTGDKGRSSLVQSFSSDLGKMLRLNKDGSIPSDNPFFTTATGKYRAIYALGLRNPYSIAVQPETGKMFFCDVGSTEWEEINEVLPGKNYGYPEIEGKRTTQTPPPNYADPFYTYGHSIGCAVIGAAFYPQNAGNFPAQYKGKFYFADYCIGRIRHIHPGTGNELAILLSGIDRAVAIAIAPDGAFYYLARSGLGGGSVEDNTESEQGSLWRIVYTGSEAPFVYTHPQSAVKVVGETLQLSIQSLGKSPLHYRWQQNGIDLAAPDSNRLVVSAVTLADSNSRIRCIVTNALGADTSAEATISVTANQRPIPVIDTPLPNTRYKAGAYVVFSGHATDPETGVVDSNNLSWKVNFHHDEHLHPVTMPTNGITTDSIFIPQIGEPSDHVWYRIHCTATDSAGLSQSVYRDVFPLTAHVAVYCPEKSVPVNADGFLGKTPYLFHSVAGMQRSLRVPSLVAETDTVFVFKQWESGNNADVLPFVTPDTGTFSATARYHIVPKANGTGLLGEYFKETTGSWDFEEQLLYIRTDSIINFEWMDGSPSPGQVPSDGFTVRWSGRIVPYVNDSLTFYVQSDDGARLWVNDSLIIDKWQPQGLFEHAGKIYLEGGKHYNIRLEYLELSGFATAQLRWSSLKIPKEIIPKRQLLLPKHIMPNSISGSIWLDVNGDAIRQPQEPLLANAVVLLYNNLTGLVAAAAITDSAGYYQLGSIPVGNYSIRVTRPPGYVDILPGYGLNAFGFSDAIELSGEEMVQLDFAFRISLEPGIVHWANSAWDVGPSPGNGALTFRKKLVAFPERFDIRVLDATGRICLETALLPNVWETTLDLTTQPAGIYFVHAGNRVVKVAIH